MKSLFEPTFTPFVHFFGIKNTLKSLNSTQICKSILPQNSLMTKLGSQKGIWLTTDNFIAFSSFANLIFDSIFHNQQQNLSLQHLHGFLLFLLDWKQWGSTQFYLPETYTHHFLPDYLSGEYKSNWKSKPSTGPSKITLSFMWWWVIQYSLQDSIKIGKLSKEFKQMFLPFLLS